MHFELMVRLCANPPDVSKRTVVNVLLAIEKGRPGWGPGPKSISLLVVRLGSRLQIEAGDGLGKRGTTWVTDGLHFILSKLGGASIYQLQSAHMPCDDCCTCRYECGCTCRSGCQLGLLIVFEFWCFLGGNCG